MPELFHTTSGIRSLFQPLERTHALAPAFFDGQMQARLFVDDIVSPQAGFLVYNSRVLCAGVPGADFLGEMKERFASDLIPAHRQKGNDAFVFLFPAGDSPIAIEALFSGHQLHHGTRQYYETVTFGPRPDPSLPEGFSMHWITPAFLASDFAGLDAVREEMCSERSSVDDFLAHGFGVCPVHEDEVAGWCMSEYNTGTRCEIGIATLERHQRKGIATLATHFFLAEARRRGYDRIGWDCWTGNIPSAATARKAGFTLVEEYPALVVIL